MRISRNGHNSKVSTSITYYLVLILITSFYDLREVFIFQSMHFLSYIIRRISRKNRAGSLEDCISFVVMLIYIMYSDAAFFFTGSHYRFMNPVTIHSFASELRQKSRMYIYNFIGISMQKQIRHANQESRPARQSQCGTPAK